MKYLRRMLAIVTNWYSQLGSLVKLAAALTTIIGVGTAAYQVYSTLHDETIRRERITTSMRLAASQLEGKDYALSWDANAKALELAPTDATAQAQQAQIAMAWLDDVRLSSKPGATKFGDISDPLLDSLARRAASPSVRGVELADLKAHIGWARFLKSRDGVTGLHVAEEFDAALKIDPDNMYGHVMRGFLLLWEGGPPEAARADFEKALNSSVNPAYRDQMILSALFNSSNDEHQFAAVNFADRIRKDGRTIDDRSRQRLLWTYEIGIGDIEYLARLSRIMPVQDHIATLDWLLTDQTDRERRQNDSVLKAYFLELAGNNPEALALYQQVVAATAPQTAKRAVELARSGIRRLTEGASGRVGVDCQIDTAKLKRGENVPRRSPGCPRN